MDLDWNPVNICINCFSVAWKYSEFRKNAVLRVGGFVQLKKKVIVADPKRRTNDQTPNAQNRSTFEDIPNKSLNLLKKRKSLNLKKKSEDIPQRILRSSSRYSLRALSSRQGTSTKIDQKNSKVLATKKVAFSRVQRKLGNKERELSALINIDNTKLSASRARKRSAETSDDDYQSVTKKRKTITLVTTPLVPRKVRGTLNINNKSNDRKSNVTELIEFKPLSFSGFKEIISPSPKEVKEFKSTSPGMLKEVQKNGKILNEKSVSSLGKRIVYPLNSSHKAVSPRNMTEENVIEAEKLCQRNSAELVNNESNLYPKENLNSNDDHICKISKAPAEESRNELGVTEFLQKPTIEIGMLGKCTSKSGIDNDSAMDGFKSSDSDVYLSASVNNFTVKKIGKSALQKINTDIQSLNTSESNCNDNLQAQFIASTSNSELSNGETSTSQSVSAEKENDSVKFLSTTPMNESPLQCNPVMYAVRLQDCAAVDIRQLQQNTALSTTHLKQTVIKTTHLQHNPMMNGIDLQYTNAESFNTRKQSQAETFKRFSQQWYQPSHPESQIGNYKASQTNVGNNKINAQETRPVLPKEEKKVKKDTKYVDSLIKFSCPKCHLQFTSGIAFSIHREKHEKKEGWRSIIKRRSSIRGQQSGAIEVIKIVDDLRSKEKYKL